MGAGFRGSVLVGLLLAGCDPAPDGSTTDAPVETTGSDEGTGDSVPDGTADEPMCFACIHGFELLVYASGENITGDVSVSYTADGAPGTNLSCVSDSCWIEEYSEVSSVELTVTYGDCEQTKETSGYTSCGCEAAVPRPPTELSFSPECTPGP